METGKDGQKRQVLAKEPLPRLFQLSAKKFAHREALCFQNRHFTYKQLDCLTDALAVELIRRSVKKGDVVSVLVRRSEYMLIAALGISKTGAVYEPLDISYPRERIHYMVHDARACLVITEKAFAERVPEEMAKLYTEDIRQYAQISEAVCQETLCRRIRELSPEDLFVLLYTSGSTGEPKGCMLTHGNLSSFCSWYVRYYEADEYCRMAVHASFSFDVCMMEMWMPLAAGACVFIIPEEIRTDLSGLNRFFEENSITHTSMTTQLGRQFAVHMQNHSLRHLTVAGETLIPLAPPKNYRLHNGYGPTEGTILLTIQQVDQEYPQGVPIGRPLDGVKLYLLDEHGSPVPDGEIGELCAAGRQISPGYLNKPEQTAAVFTENPFTSEAAYKTIYHTGDLARRMPDGTYMFHGRKDRQVKLRGFRVELPEVEGVIRAFPGIRDAAAVVHGTGSDQVLTAYYVTEQELADQEPFCSALAQFIGQKKPQYMVPSFFVRLDSIPVNTNGKVDVKSLPLPDREAVRTDFQPPRTKTEKKLAAIYQDLLGIKRAGRQDDFICLGGHSLKAMSLLFAVEETFHKTLNIQEIMEHSTLFELADCIDAHKNGIGETQVKTEDVFGELCRCSAAQKRMYTADSMTGTESTLYHLPMHLCIYGTFHKKRFLQALETMFRRHEILRTCFFMRGQELWQRILPPECAGELAHLAKRNQPKLRSFDLGQCPLCSYYIAENTDGAIQTTVSFDFHHIISDGTSMILFSQELMQLYHGEEPAPAGQYREFCFREMTGNIKGMKDAWRLAMPEEIPVLDILTDKNRIEYTGDKNSGGHVFLQAGAELTRLLCLRCREYGVTAYMFLLSVYVVLLSRYSRQNDLMIGTPMAGRQHKSEQNMQGIF